MYFAGFGCISAIGANAQMTISAIDAGISGYASSDFQTKTKSPATIASLDDGIFFMSATDTEFEGPVTAKMDRSAKMMHHALSDLHNTISEENAAILEEGALPLIWLQEEPHASRAIVPLAFIKDQLDYFEAPIELSTIYPVSMGRAGGIAALERAYQLLHQAGHEHVLIGGVECPFHKPWLRHLDENDRLKTPESYDAFAPGEGAAFLLLSRTPEHAYTEDNHHLQIALPGVTQSPAHWYNNTPNTAEALHEAMNKALENRAQLATQLTPASQTKIDSVLSSMNGENFWAKEFGIAMSRLSDTLQPNVAHEHPFEYTGDLGCISGIFLTGLAAHRILTGQYSNALCYASSDDAWRSAVYMTKS